MRNTEQKSVILEVLKTHKDHPTADQIYSEVREKLPKISLGTVYRNLEKLSSNGTVLRLELGGGQKRFDPNPSDHGHFRCIACSAVEDIPDEMEISIPSVDNTFGRKRTIMGTTLEYYGYCEKCTQKKG